MFYPNDDLETKGFIPGTLLLAKRIAAQQRDTRQDPMMYDMMFGWCYPYTCRTDRFDSDHHHACVPNMSMLLFVENTKIYGNRAIVISMDPKCYGIFHSTLFYWTVLDDTPTIE
jgi:hypothetical protein